MMDHGETVNTREKFRFDVEDAPEYVRLWTGSTAKLADQLNIKHYLVTQALVRMLAMQCIRLLHRGNQASPTVYHLVQEPTKRMYISFQSKDMLTGHYRPMTGMQRLTDSVNRLYNHVSALEQRIERLEREQANHARSDPE